MKTSPEKSRIRPARANEAPSLSELALRSKAHWGYSPEFLQACRAELSYGKKQLLFERMRFFALESAGQVVGFYALAHQSRTEFELEALFVEPAFIGKGFGRLLVEHAKSVTSEMGGTNLVVQGDPHAERFYLAAGGVPTGSTESGSVPGRLLPTFSINLSGNQGG
ncbi:MAG: GNAT family N-acetyltransferase [Ectothiorhodospiraceae bacterium]|nr:GNAT family N-acetyltransferase [Ectothiorhodospiraceae bacterium]